MVNTDLDNIELSLNEYKRYSRHLLLPEIQIEGQKRLLQAKILCIGVGGLGSSFLLYLAAAGIGNITILDKDFVDISNLQRQIIHRTSFLNFPKIDSAKNSIKTLNPNCKVTTCQKNLDRFNIVDLIKSHDIIIDGTDNIQTRYLIDEVSYSLSKPWVYGSIFQFEGQVSVFNYQGGPSYKDVYPLISTNNADISCSEGGVLGILPGIVGTLQATEVLKIILGIGKILSGQLLTINTLDLQFKKSRIRKNAGLFSQTIIPLSEFEHNQEIEEDPNLIEESNFNLLLQKDLVTLIDVRSEIEFTIDHIPGALNYPLKMLYNTNTLQSLSQSSKMIVLYCNLDSRSKIGSKILESSNVACKRLKNGLYAWNKIQKQSQQYSF